MIFAFSQRLLQFLLCVTLHKRGLASLDFRSSSVKHAYFAGPMGGLHWIIVQSSLRVGFNCHSSYCNTCFNKSLKHPVPWDGDIDVWHTRVILRGRHWSSFSTLEQWMVNYHISLFSACVFLIAESRHRAFLRKPKGSRYWICPFTDRHRHTKGSQFFELSGKLYPDRHYTYWNIAYRFSLTPITTFVTKVKLKPLKY